MNNQRMIALAEATADHIAAKRKERQQTMKNQCPACGQDMREEPREDCPQCGQSSPAPALLAQRDALEVSVNLHIQLAADLRTQRDCLLEAAQSALIALNYTGSENWRDTAVADLERAIALAQPQTPA